MNKNLTPDAIIGRVAALEWMVAQLYAITLRGLSEDPKGFLDANREMIEAKIPGWRLPSDLSVEAALEVFDRIFSIAEKNAVIMEKHQGE